MTTRARRVRLLVVALALAAFGVAMRAEAHRQSTASVCIEVRMPDHLSGQAFTTMREEANRIRLRQRIALRWEQQISTECETVVRIAFDDEALRKASGAKNADVVAVTVFSGPFRAVYISLARAFQMLEQLREMLNVVSDIERDLRGGMLLGRLWLTDWAASFFLQRHIPKKIIAGTGSLSSYPAGYPQVTWRPAAGLRLNVGRE